MTREEAIQVLQTALTSPFIYGEYADAIGMAIEALSEPSETPTTDEKHQLSSEAPTETPTTDLISRADAMGAVQDHFNADGFKGYDDGQKMMDRIKALPSADAVHIETYRELYEKYVEMKHASADRPSGEWKYLHGSVGSYMTIHCPFCGNTFNDVAEWKYNYCPSCGARMKGGDSE